MQEQTGGERQMSVGLKRKSVYQHLSVNVICHSDAFLRDMAVSFPHGLFCFLMPLCKEVREGCEGMCVCLKQKRHILSQGHLCFH